jgi:hypothetical protein
LIAKFIAHCGEKRHATNAARSIVRGAATVCLVLSLGTVAALADDDHHNHDEHEYSYDEVIAVIDERRPDLLQLIEKIPANFDDDMSREEVILEHLGWIPEIAEEASDVYAQRYVDVALQLAHAELSLHLYLYDVELEKRELDTSLLKRLVTKVFTSKIALHELEVEDIKRELVKHEEKLDYAKVNREKLIDRRVNELTGADDDEMFEW